MSAQSHLALAATHLDDAIEHLTFDRFDWAFESLWRGAASMRHATGAAPIAIPPLGKLPSAGALSGRGGERRDDPLHRLADAIEALRDLVDPNAFEASCAARASEIEGLVFAASDLLLRLAKRERLIDPGAVYGSLSGAWVPPGYDDHRRAHRLNRRALLGLLGAGAVGTLTACRSGAAPPARANEPTPASAREPEIAPVEPATVRATTRLTGQQWPTSDPFLFCAYHVDAYPEGDGSMRPNASLAGRNLGRDFDPNADWRMYHGQEIPGFPRHPHRGFETVTVVRRGLLDHADSMGAAARYGDGDVQWLTAGDGIQHAEMFPLVHTDRDNTSEFFQIWMNLPAANKRVPPHFTMIWSDDVPRLVERDSQGLEVELTLSAGAYGNHAPPSPPPNSWASQPESDVAIWSLRLAAGATFTLPPVQDGTERSLYFHRGNGGLLGERAIADRTRVELAGAGPIELRAADAELEVLLLQGRPIGEPVARRGPFVMNTSDEIREAYSDYRRTQFGGWPWQGDGPVHRADRGRFALRPDGTLEEPT